MDLGLLCLHGFLHFLQTNTAVDTILLLRWFLSLVYTHLLLLLQFSLLDVQIVSEIFVL